MPRPCPGANCCDPPEPPCGCAGPAVLTISNADALYEFIGVRFSPGPCNYMQFTGLDAIEGTYEIDLSGGSSSGELIRVAATNNPQDDDFFNEYCVYVRLIWSYVDEPECTIAIQFQVKVILLSGGTCPDLEDVDFSSPNTCSLTGDNFNPEVPVCENLSGTVSCLSYVEPEEECDTKYYTFDWTLTYA
jgi:hypothetical protein